MIDSIDPLTAMVLIPLAWVALAIIVWVQSR